jgi:hypothetical protein
MDIVDNCNKRVYSTIMSKTIGTILLIFAFLGLVLLYRINKTLGKIYTQDKIEYYVN